MADNRKSVRILLDDSELWQFKKYCLEHHSTMQSMLRDLILGAISKDQENSTTSESSK